MGHGAMDNPSSFSQQPRERQVLLSPPGRKMTSQRAGGNQPSKVTQSGFHDGYEGWEHLEHRVAPLVRHPGVHEHGAAGSVPQAGLG